MVQSVSQGKSSIAITFNFIMRNSVSVCASLNSISVSKDERKYIRAIPLALFTVSYLSFSVMFGNQLWTWDEYLTGHCYNTQLLPLNDHIYLGATFIWTLGALLGCCSINMPCTFGYLRIVRRLYPATLLPTSHTTLTPPLRSPQPIAENGFWSELYYISATSHDALIMAPVIAGARASLFFKGPEAWVWTIIPLAIVHYPLHLCMVIALRLENEDLLSGDSENTWGFGQIVSLIVCAAALLECAKGALGKTDTFTKTYLLIINTFQNIDGVPNLTGILKT
jgi:hypothetical protein